MARKNRKKGQAGLGFPIPLVVALVAIAGLSLVYVCLQSRMGSLGRDIKVLEARRDQLREKVVREQCNWARLQSPSSIEQALKAHGLAMTWPGRDQIVRVRYDGVSDAFTGSLPSPRLGRTDRIVMND
jgi:hypothetical protein